MLAYLNRGFILEQAICDFVDNYVQFFETRVTLQHPFARIYMDNSMKAADHFPAIVVSTYNDGKPADLPMRPQFDGIGLNKEDVDLIIKTTETVTINGKPKERKIPGYCKVIVPETMKILDDHFKNKKYIYGLVTRIYRCDKISIDIWAENIQLKNELYEQLRLFIAGHLRHLLTTEKYRVHDVKIDDDTIYGQRSGAYNDQFDVILSGANLSFDVNYAIEHIILDTEIENPNRDIFMEVKNHVEVQRDNRRQS